MMPSDTDATFRQRRMELIRRTALSAAVLVIAALVTLWAQRTFWPEGVLADLLPYCSLLYLLMLPPLFLSLKRRLDALQKGGDSDAARHH